VLSHVLETGCSETCEYSLKVPAGTRSFVTGNAKSGVSAQVPMRGIHELPVPALHGSVAATEYAEEEEEHVEGIEEDRCREQRSGSCVA